MTYLIKKYKDSPLSKPLSIHIIQYFVTKQFKVIGIPMLLSKNIIILHYYFALRIATSNKKNMENKFDKFLFELFDGV